METNFIAKYEITFFHLGILTSREHRSKSKPIYSSKFDFIIPTNAI